MQSKSLRLVSRIVCVAALAAGALPAMASAEAPRDLFVESPERSPSATWPHVEPLRLVIPVLRPSLESAEALRLTLAPGVEIVAERETVRSRAPGRYTWIGGIAGDPLGSVILVVRDRTVTGNIRTSGGLFQIRRRGPDAHVVARVDVAGFPAEAQPVIRAFAPGVGSSSHGRGRADDGAVPRVDGGDYLDVLVVYSKQARLASADIVAEIQLGVEETNLSFENSGIPLRVRLVFSAEVQDGESGSTAVDLDRLQHPADGVMDVVHTWRDAYCADVVSLWTESGTSCGLGFQNVSNDPSFAPLAFSVVRRTCATGNFSFGHEIGHNIGAQHDRLATANPGAFSYSHGLVNLDDRWRTLMAIDNGCLAMGFSCTRLPYWSNPDVFFGGDPTGIPETEADSADHRLTLANTAAVAANFRDSTACVLAVPEDGLTLTLAGSQITADWQATCGVATDYTLYSGNLDTLSASGSYTHDTLVCSDVGGDLTETFAPAPWSEYYIVVPRDAQGLEGDYGFDRPQGADSLTCGITSQRPGGCP